MLNLFSSFCKFLIFNFKKLALQDIDILSVLLSAICHDFKHNGYTNNFHINAKTRIALRYNDASVLENFHVAETFKILQIEENNLLCRLKPEEWRLVRKRMIDCILSTDMANHAKNLNTLKAKLETFDIRGGKNVERMIFSDNVARTYENQQLVLGLCVHTADVSNPAKPEVVYGKWVDLVFTEFFNQGDLEKIKGLPVSLLCDRATTSISKSQIGFINFVVLPTFDALTQIMPEIHEYTNKIKQNLKKYEEKAKDEEKVASQKI
jgi:hypothetical protein